MEELKLLEYAQYGAANKGMDYLRKSEKTSSHIKAASLFQMYEQCTEDCKEINCMIDELKEKGEA